MALSESVSDRKLKEKLKQLSTNYVRFYVCSLYIMVSTM